MNDSPETRLAVQDERLKNIQEMMQQDSVDKKEIQKQVAQMFQILTSIDGRVKALEEHAEKHAEIYQEFLALQSEVIGAKKVIRGLWLAISGLVALGLSIKAELVNWFRN